MTDEHFDTYKLRKRQLCLENSRSSCIEDPSKKILRTLRKSSRRQEKRKKINVVKAATTGKRTRTQKISSRRIGTASKNLSALKQPKQLKVTAKRNLFAKDDRKVRKSTQQNIFEDGNNWNIENSTATCFSSRPLLSEDYFGKLRKFNILMSEGNFGEWIDRLRSLQISDLTHFVSDVVNSERHLQLFKERNDILYRMKNTEEFERFIQSLYDRGLDLLSSSSNDHPDDKGSLFKIRFTYHIGDLLRENTREHNWFKENFKDVSESHYNCVVHSLGAAVCEFIKWKALELKESAASKKES